MAERPDDKIRLGGLWTQTTSGGAKYLSGSLGQAKLLIFPNSYAKNDNDPTHILYLAPGKPRSQEATGHASTTTSVPRQAANNATRPAPSGSPDEDDIPF